MHVRAAGWDLPAGGAGTCRVMPGAFQLHVAIGPRWGRRHTAWVGGVVLRLHPRQSGRTSWLRRQRIRNESYTCPCIHECAHLGHGSHLSWQNLRQVSGKTSCPLFDLGGARVPRGSCRQLPGPDAARGFSCSPHLNSFTSSHWQRCCLPLSHLQSLGHGHGVFPALPCGFPKSVHPDANSGSATCQL